MSIDPNEIGGFINSCRNADYLKHLRDNIDHRLLVLKGLEPAKAATVQELQRRASFAESRAAQAATPAKAEEILAKADAMRQAAAEELQRTTTPPAATSTPSKGQSDTSSPPAAVNTDAKPKTTPAPGVKATAVTVSDLKVDPEAGREEKVPGDGK